MREYVVSPNLNPSTLSLSRVMSNASNASNTSNRRYAHTKTTEEWIRDVFPVTYPDHTPLFLPLLSGVKPSGQKVAVWDRMFYLQHRTDDALSFFIVEYGIPLRKGTVDMIATYVKDTRDVLSKVGCETEMEVSSTYHVMIQTLRCVISRDSFDLPIYILLTHPLKPTMIKYLQMIHTGSISYEYEGILTPLCMSDGQLCVFDDMTEMKIRGPREHVWCTGNMGNLRDLAYENNGMIKAYDWLKEENLLDRVDPRATPYVTPYWKIRPQLEGLKGRVIMEHVMQRDCPSTLLTDDGPFTHREYEAHKCSMEYDAEDHTDCCLYPPYLLRRWMNDIFPLEYPEYHVRHVRIRDYYSASGKRVSLRFDNLFYFEHHLERDLSFFMIEYCRPLQTRVVEKSMMDVQEIQDIFSAIGVADGLSDGLSDGTADGVFKYREMVRILCEDTGLSPKQCHLSFRVLYSYPVSYMTHRRLLTLHYGIMSWEYDLHAYHAFIHDPSYDDYKDHISHAPQFPRHLRPLLVPDFLSKSRNMMTSIRNAFEEEGMMESVPESFLEYFQPYDAVETLLDFTRRRIVIGLIDVE